MRDRRIYRYVLLAALFIGWMYYGLYYFGLKFTSPGNAAIMAEMELFFSYLLFNVWKKEKFSAAHTWGAVLMLVGAFVLLYPHEGIKFHSGDWLILLATACAPVGNFYQQKLRKMVSSETILFLRSLFTFPFFFLFAYFLNPAMIWPPNWWMVLVLVLNGFFVVGLSKILWVEGIHRISVTKANALSTPTPLLTLIFAYLFLHQTPTMWQMLSIFPMIAGLILLTF